MLRIFHIRLRMFMFFLILPSIMQTKLFSPYLMNPMPFLMVTSMTITPAIIPHINLPFILRQLSLIFISTNWFIRIQFVLIIRISFSILKFTIPIASIKKTSQ